jgi:hypothetical protein
MEMERVKPEPNIIIPNQFRRNDDQKIQVPFKTEKSHR